MFRKAFISLVATAVLAAGTVGVTTAADAKKYHRHHRPHSHITLGFGYRYPAYYDDYGYEDCGYRRVKVKRWNKSHTHRIVIIKKRWVCY